MWFEPHSKLIVGDNDVDKDSKVGATYGAAGVNLKASRDIKDKIKTLATQTYGNGVVGGVGGFGALYKVAGYTNPVLVTSTDPVGTKLMVAGMAGSFENIGADLVNACVNDLIVIGADPLFFLDYIATSKMNPEVVEILIKGIAEACAYVDCALIGGVTSEMPGVFAGDNFDLSGFIVGAVEEHDMLRPTETIVKGDVLVGIPSNGLHTNGYSLVRHIFGLDNDPTPLTTYYDDLGETLVETLLKPHQSYYHDLRKIFGFVKGITHITGGGIYENVPRMLPTRVTAKFSTSLWEVPPIFNIIQMKGKVDPEEMYHVFNMGLGMIAAVEKSYVGKVLDLVKNSVVVGEIVEYHHDSEIVIQG